MMIKSLLIALVALPIFSATTYTPRHHKKCTNETMEVRKEWASMSKASRVAYTNAVTCLQSLPSQLDNALYPGAKSRYDDFLAVHINMTSRIHLSGYFLSWHRGFVRLYEKALQNECNYNGTQPYWNWPLWATNLSSSPLFDGSPYSLGSDGLAIPNATAVILGPNVTLPHGNGGGCIHSGPFANTTTPFRAFSFSEALTGQPPLNAFNYTPSCLSRDLNPYIASRYTSASAVSTLLRAPNISIFQAILSGTPATYDLGSHGGGHFSLGENGADFFASPADPAFYLHHAQIDRLWTGWQEQDLDVRPWELSGTMTVLNTPPSANVTLEDLVEWDVLGEDRRMGDLAVVGREEWLCYRYE